MSVTEGTDNSALVHCHAGCEKEAVVAAWGLDDEGPLRATERPRGRGILYLPKTTSTGQPATLENYAAYVELPVEFLKSLGLKEYRHLGEPAVSMPYLDENGEVLLTRSRVSLTGKPKVKTRKGDKHRLYGLWKLEEAREAGYAVARRGRVRYANPLVSRRACVGIPGANGWKAEWAADLEGIDRLYFVVEDEAGEQCWRKLAATPGPPGPALQGRARRRKGRFRAAQARRRGLQGVAAREPARTPETWLDIAETEEQERARERRGQSATSWQRAQTYSQEFSRDLEACRVVGERTNGELLFLALMSRLLDKIVSVAVKGPSSGGKSYLVKLVMSFFPGTAFCRFTAMSEKTLLYTDEPLSHRHLILSEAAGISGDFQEYVIRTLLSEGSSSTSSSRRPPRA